MPSNSIVMKFTNLTKMFLLIRNKAFLHPNYLFQATLGQTQRLQYSTHKVNLNLNGKFTLKESNLIAYKKNRIKSPMDFHLEFVRRTIQPILCSASSHAVLLPNNSQIVQPLAKNLYQRRPISTLGIKFKTKQKRSKRKFSSVSTSEQHAFEKKSIEAPPAIINNNNDNVADANCVTDEIISKEVHLLNPKFTALPKNVLHNVFDVLTKELSDADLKVHPVYHAVNNKNTTSWSCTYHVKWPERMKFVGMGRTKKEASHKAALACLTWLRKHDKINKEGQPIVVDHKQHKELVRKSIPGLVLDKKSQNYFNEIIYLHKEEFMPKLVDTLKENNEEDDYRENEENNLQDGAQEIRFNRNLKQRFLGFNKYLAKEKVVLPIAEYKEQFIDLLSKNSVVIVKGEPGCGKSTRIPQYVLESWIREAGGENTACRIAVTQPRRIAAISLAERVSSERNESTGHIVGYQVRLKSNFNQSTGRILYCTTGILLRHLQSDPNLSNFTHVILDEAHERDVNTDLLMNILKKTLQTNPNLKLIVMSATIDAEKFTEYFNNAPLMHIPGFTYPVEQHFLDEIRNVDLLQTRAMCESDSPKVIQEDVVKVINLIHKKKPDGAILCFLPGWEDISKIQKLLTVNRPRDMSVLCLHSRVRDSDQWKIFSRPPPGVRKVILATNIAETSVTVDDVVYVIDTGIHKETRFDNDKGILCIDNHWVSKSSMKQRKGRAGRVQAGESFHLYPKKKYESFPDHTIPEILRTSLTKIVLDAKVYSNNQDASEFMDQLPSPPDKVATRRAVRELKDLDLLDDNENLTSLGRTLANFQLEPKLAKALVNSVVYKCVTPIVDIITLFSGDLDIFSNSLTDKDGIKRIKSFGCKSSDHLALMRLLEKWLELMDEKGENVAEMFCQDAKVVHHKLVTISKLREIHFDYLRNGLENCIHISDAFSDNDELVKAVLYSGVGTLLQHRNWDVVKGRYKKSNVFLTNYNQKATITSDSVNFKKTSFPSNLLVYINEMRSNIRRATLVRETSVISPVAVLLFSNKNLAVKESGLQDGKVILHLVDTKIEFLCSEMDADKIIKCKEALNAAYQYFIFQMTEGGQFDSNINNVWDRMLQNVDKVLLNCNIE